MKNKIRVTYFIFFIIVGKLSANAQIAQNKLTILIDTLIGIDPHRNDFEVQLCYDTTFFKNPNDTFVIAKIVQKNKFYQAIVSINLEWGKNALNEPSPLQSIEFPISYSHGYISLRNFEQYKNDTVKIEKWEILKDNPADTIFKFTKFQKMVNEKIISETNKFDTIINKNKLKNNELNNLKIIINHKEYITDLKVAFYKVNGTFDGADPLKNYLSYKENHNPKRKYRYTLFSGETIEINKTYNSVTYLK